MARPTLTPLLLAAALGLGCRAEPVPTYRNLVLVVVDTLRSDHLGAYGYPRATSPFLDRLAAEGVRLQGYAASSWTRPSVASILTGLEPQRHQTIGRLDVLPEAAPYLPALLDARGFSTVGVVSNPNVAGRWGFSRGFDRWWQARAAKADGARLVERVGGFAADLRAPYFLYVHFVDPHDPYEPPEPWSDPDDPPWEPVQPRQVEKGWVPLTPEVANRLRRAYDGEVRDVDDHLRRLLGELDARGALAETLVVVTSDHGEELGEHGRLTHGQTLYEEMLRVPLVFWAKEGLRPYAAADRFALVDLAPTLLQALSLPAPEATDGIGRWAEVTAGRPPGDPERDLWAHLDLDARAALAVRRGSLKVIHSAEEPLRATDLDLDPGEQAYRSEPERASREALRDLVAHHNALADGALRREERGLDEESRRALAALGYLKGKPSRRELQHREIPDRLDPRLGLAAEGRDPR